MGANVHFLNRVDWFLKQILNPYFCNMKTFEDRLSSENSFFLLAGPCAIEGRGNGTAHCRAYGECH